MLTKTKKSDLISEKKTEIGKKYVDRIENSRTFEPLDKPQVGIAFWIPKRRGETIRGHIGSPIQNYHRQSSYPIKTENGTVYEVFGNKQLHQLIRKADCIGQLIEIEYRGKQFTYAGHYRKIYRLFKIKN